MVNKKLICFVSPNEVEIFTRSWRVNISLGRTSGRTNQVVIFCHQKLEGRVASDEDLKLSDTVRYYMRDSEAAKDLLYRRTRSLADYEAANKNLEKARTKNKDVPAVRITLCLYISLLYHFIFFEKLANGFKTFLKSNTFLVL